ncbi:nucleotidyltransferase domain-containing protein [Streptomyces sp. NPDC014802]
MFAGADFPWWIAGGYAIELAVGRELRPHGDLESWSSAATRRSCERC